MTELNIWNIPVRLFIVFIVSGTLGLERTSKRRGAGIRTYIIVSLGAALTMMTSQFLNQYVADGYADLSRLGAQVISGIGFIGAGTIMFTGFKQIKGITTAAGLWGSACIGLAIGAGFIYASLVAWLMMMIVMSLMDRWETRYYASSNEIRLYIIFESFLNFRSFMQKVKNDNFVVKDFEMDKAGFSSHEVAVSISLRKVVNGKNVKVLNHDKLIDRFSSYPGVLIIEEI